MEAMQATKNLTWLDESVCFTHVVGITIHEYTNVLISFIVFAVFHSLVGGE